MHILGSILPSRFTFILAAFVTEVPAWKSGEDKENTVLSINSFNEVVPCWRNASLVLTDDGGVYEGFTKDKLIPSTMKHGKCAPMGEYETKNNW